MIQNYISSTFFTQYSALVKYYIIFYSCIIPSFINGFIFKSNSLYIIINSALLHFCLMFLKFIMVSSVNSLLDLVVIDYPARIENRFELIYAF
jgi:hypothetical protein